MDIYQQWTRRSAFYPEAGVGTLEGIIYTTLGLGGESGEYTNKIKKVLRDNGGQFLGNQKYELAKELGDVLWYVARCADELGYSLHDIANWNIKKLEDRMSRDTIKGSGDNR